MWQVNPDPHAAGYEYWPTHAVTANFPHGVDVQALQRAFTDAGLATDQVQVLQGAAGAALLDLEGERHGSWVRFHRELDRMLSDEMWYMDRQEEVLQSGGVVVAAFTGGDDARKHRTAEVLKSHGGQEVRYWGNWIIADL